MVVKINRIKQAQDSGASSSDIVSSIQRNEQSLSGNIQKARDNQFSDDEILSAIVKRGERNTLQDIGTQAVTAPITGLTAVPKTTADLIDMGLSFATDPGQTSENILRGTFGLGEPDIAEPKDTLGGRIGQVVTGERTEPQSPAGFLFGKERAQSIKEATGIQAVENVLDGLTANIKSFLFDPKKGTVGDFLGLSREDLPDRQKTRDQLSEFLDVDLDPQTYLGRMTEVGIGSLAENAPLFGLGPAGQIAKATMVHDTAIEAGAPQWLASTLEIGSLFGKLKRPPAKQVLKTGAEITEEELSNFRNKIKQPTEAGLVEGAEFLEEAGQREAQEAARLSEEAPLTEKPTVDISQPLKASEIIKTIENETKDPLLNSLAPVKDVETGLEAYKGAVSENFTRERGKTSNLYNEVINDIGKGATRNNRTIAAIDKWLAEVEESGLSGTGKKTVVDAVKELKKELQSNPTFKKSIKLKQSFSQLFDFDFPDLETKAKANRSVSRIRKTYTSELNDNIRKRDKSAFSKWRKAELSHQKNVDLFGKDSIIKLQRGESVLDSRGALSRPQDIGFFKNAVGDQLEMKRLLDRLVMEEMDIGKMFSKSQQDKDIWKRRFTKEGVKVFDELIDLSDPNGIAKKSAELQRRVIEDVQHAHTAGTKPEVTLKMMQNPKGYDLVNKALSSSEESRAALRNMEDLLVKEVFQDVSKGGEVARDQARQLMRNRPLMEVLKKIAPEEARALKQLSETPVAKGPTVFGEKKSTLQRQVIEEALASKITGKAPTRTIEIMKTPQGLDFVRETLKDRVGGAKLIRELEGQLLSDTLDKLIVNGKLDAAEVTKLLENKDLVKVLKKIDPAIEKIIERLPEFVTEVEATLEEMSASNKSLVRQKPLEFAAGLLLLESLGVPVKSLLILTKGLPAAKRMIGKAIRDPNALRLLKVIEKNPKSAKNAIKELTAVLNKKE